MPQRPVMLTTELGVLMVTGAYYPELSGGGLQCRELVRQLRESARFTILTTTADPTLPALDERDGVPVHRVAIDASSYLSKIAGALRVTRVVLRNRHRFSIVHLHGFSQKAILLTLLARLLGKRILLTLQTSGHDEALPIRGRSRLAFWWFSQADLFTGVSLGLQRSYHAAGLQPEKFRLIPNGVDISRFRSPHAAERKALRRQLGLLSGGRIVLFVGFFSKEKCPDRVFEAWASLALTHRAIGPLVFVGATRSRYYEVDPQLVDAIKRRARDLGLEDRVVFVEKTLEIEQYYRAADIFVLPSLREGLPNALIEAMASGIACVASRLDGATDDLIEDSANGLLVPPGDVPALEAALRFLVDHPGRMIEFGRRARQTIEARFTIGQTAQQYLDAYRTLMGQPTYAA